MTAQTNPQRLLAGDNPRLIDEWQIAPELWDAIRFDVDHSDKMELKDYLALLFETLVARDLRTYAAANDGRGSHYRDKSGLECDAVMHLRDGCYGLIEVKIGGTSLIAEGRAKLQRLANEIDTKKMKKPAFRMIVVAEGDFAYEEPDGTLICPIGCLKP